MKYLQICIMSIVLITGTCWAETSVMVDRTITLNYSLDVTLTSQQQVELANRIQFTLAMKRVFAFEVTTTANNVSVQMQDYGALPTVNFWVLASIHDHLGMEVIVNKCK